MRGHLSLIYGHFKVDISQRKSLIPTTTQSAVSATNTATFPMIHHFNCLKYDISMAIIMVIKHDVYTILVSIAAGFCHLGAAVC